MMILRSKADVIDSKEPLPEYFLRCCHLGHSLVN